MFRNFRTLPYYSPDADDGGAGDTDLDPANTTKSDGGKSEKGTDYEEAYKGLQKKYNVLYKKFERSEEKVSDLEVKIADLEIANEKFKNAETSTKDLVANTGKQVVDLQAQIDAKDKEIQRFKIVVNDYPDLAPIMDTLPVVDDLEKFKENLKGLSSTIQKQVDLKVKQRLEGVSVNDSDSGGKTTPPGKATFSSEQLYDKLATFPPHRNAEEEAKYQETYQQYLGALKAEQQ